MCTRGEIGEMDREDHPPSCTSTCGREVDVQEEQRGIGPYPPAAAARYSQADLHHPGHGACRRGVVPRKRNGCKQTTWKARQNQSRACRGRGPGSPQTWHLSAEGAAKGEDWLHAEYLESSAASKRGMLPCSGRQARRRSTGIPLRGAMFALASFCAIWAAHSTEVPAWTRL